MHSLKENNTFKTTCIISAFLMSFLFDAHTQISPGELTKAHAQLEGILNCTKCHVLGDKASNEKCLECHKEIKSRIDQKKGFHSSAEVTGKDCFTCHSDHHGRNFEIIRFDTDRFDHQSTGYKLVGAHERVDCIACHKDEWIASGELKKKDFTYLGLQTSCMTCHKDVHQKTLSTTDCAVCHTVEAFVPAALFDHAQTDFPLKGKHKEVDCKRCHELTFTNSALLQRFAGIPFASCANCHEDVHNNKFGNKCKECHSEESFNYFVGKSSFNHSETSFPLVGQHKKVDCASCHKIGDNAQAENIFQDYKGKDIQNCITCHKDIHETKFGVDCKACHTEESFQKTLHLDRFDHSPTGYPLSGKHIRVDCIKCHETQKMTDPVDHGLCLDCHDDFHKGQFVRDNYKPDCKECHSVDGFPGSFYTIEKHNQGTFPLEGAHLATPCFSCHQKNEDWSFRNIGQNCVDCHTDIHKGFLNEKYYPQQTCIQCHIAENWAQVSFDHLLTGFELKGKHTQAACATCHKADSTTASIIIHPFSGLKTDCVSCHDNVHDKQFERDGTTDCRRCHEFEQWKPSNFDHNTARFVLDGAHKKVSCRECHKEEVADGRAVVQYRLEQFECATCHK